MRHRAILLILTAACLGRTLYGQAPSAASAPVGRDVSWARLLPNIGSDQKRIWLFPTRLARGRNWLPTLVVLGATAALIQTDAHTAPYFRSTTSYSRFNSIFTSNATELGTLVAPVALYGAGLIAKNSYARRTALLAGEAVGDVEILTSVMKDLDNRKRPAAYPPNTRMNDSVVQQPRKLDSRPRQFSLRPRHRGVLGCDGDRAAVPAPEVAALRRLRLGGRGGLFPADAIGAFPFGRSDGRSSGLLRGALRRPAPMTPAQFRFDRLASWLALLAVPGILFSQSAVTAQSVGPCAKPGPGPARPWSLRPSEQKSGAQAPGVASLLLVLEPASVAEPLDFTGFSSARFPLISQRAFSWTSVLFTLNGMNVTDPYQPGRTDAPLDPSGIGELVVCNGFDLGASRAYGSEIAAIAETPQSAWHGEASASGTASLLAADNLPGVAARGPLKQTAEYLGYTGETLQLGGAAGRRIDWLASTSGQWSKQTVPLADPGADRGDLLLNGSALARIQLTSQDQLQLFAGGSRTRLPDWGMPAGIEAWIGRRSAPSFTIPSIEGFPGMPETDDFRFFQADWNRLAAAGVWQLRYAASAANLDTAVAGPAGVQSQIDMVTGMTNGVAPLANQAERTRQTIAATYERAPIQSGKSRHVLSLGAEWETSGIGNSYSAPSNLNPITAAGAPAFVVDLNTPAVSHERIRDFTAYARDSFTVRPWLAFDWSLLADLVPRRAYRLEQRVAARRVRPHARHSARGDVAGKLRPPLCSAGGPLFGFRQS